MSRIQGQIVTAPNVVGPAGGTRRGAGAGVALAIFAWLALTAGLRPLALPDEGRYVGVAREMIASGNWVTPTLDGLPYFHKPPLFYWLTAASMSVFGENQAAARAAPLLGAWVAAFALFAFVRRWTGEREARLAVVALLAMPLVYGGAQYANMDMLVAGLIAATVLLLAHAVLCVHHGLPYRRTVRVAYAAAALGVLAKGLIGAALPMLAIVGWLLATRRWRVVPRLVSGWGVLLFAAIALPWFLALERRWPGFLDYFFIVQQVRRFAAGGFNNVRPFWFYPAVVAVASLPWLPWLARLRVRGYWRNPRQGPIRTLMLAWAVLVTLFFSIPQSKIPGYIFPALPPLAFFLADALQAFGEPTRRLRRLWATSAALSAATGVAVVVGLTLYPYRSTRELALALGHEIGVAPRRPTPVVFMLEEDYFDLPFYAALPVLVNIVDDWDTPGVQEHDNWRKELADAEAFKGPGGTSPLITPAQLPARLCRSPVSWLIGPADATARYPFLKQAHLIAIERGLGLWRVEPAGPALAAALGCLQVSSVSSGPTNNAMPAL